MQGTFRLTFECVSCMAGCQMRLITHLVYKASSTFFFVAVLIAAAVEFLHGHRIIHRDLKPENVVISHADNKVRGKKGGSLEPLGPYCWSLSRYP